MLPVSHVNIFRDDTVALDQTSLQVAGQDPVSGLLDLPKTFAGSGGQICIPLVAEALYVRREVVLGDGSASQLGGDGDVNHFLPEIGFWNGGRWDEAVSTALLGGWTTPMIEGQRLGSSALEVLKADARAIHRGLTPLWQRRANGARVLLLDTPLSGSGLTLHDLVAGSPDRHDVAGGAEPDDPRLAALLRALEHAERDVVLSWAHAGVTTWAEAALQAGAADPIVLGERVRRKVKRLVSEQERRRALLHPSPSSDPGHPGQAPHLRRRV